MEKKKKIIGLALLGIPVAVGLYFIYKQFASKNVKKDVAPPASTVVKENGTTGTSTTTNSSDFPLKKGSYNSSVGTLQALLNSTGEVLVVDNKFGSKTEAALQKVYGKKQIDSPADLIALSDKLKLTSAKSTAINWAWKLVDMYNEKYEYTKGYFQRAYDYLLVKSPINLIGVTPFGGGWKNTSKQVTLNPTKLSLNDYAIRSALNDGTLRIEILNGAMKGMYSTPLGFDLSKTLEIVK